MKVPPCLLLPQPMRVQLLPSPLLLQQLRSTSSGRSHRHAVGSPSMWGSCTLQLLPLLVCQLDEHRDCAWWLTVGTKHHLFDEGGAVLWHGRFPAGSWENHLHGGWCPTVGRCLLRHLLPRKNPSSGYSLPAFYPSTASESHKDEVTLPSSPSPGGIFLLPLPTFLLWNVLASF